MKYFVFIFLFLSFYTCKAQQVTDEIDTLFVSVKHLIPKTCIQKELPNKKPKDYCSFESLIYKKQDLHSLYYELKTTIPIYFSIKKYKYFYYFTLLEESEFGTVEFQVHIVFFDL